ncbi:MAG TPA: hypothetical protein VLA14_09280 [Polyangia bacterium]|nr:hypothetical protein [Polyangia bacterium]
MYATTKTTKTTNTSSLKVRTAVKAGGLSTVNHSRGLKVRTAK